MSSSAYIEVTGADAVLVTSADEARKQRDQLLTDCRALDAIQDKGDAAAFVEVLQLAKNFTRFVEASRKSAKEPVLDFGKRIDSVARELVAELDVEADRISRLLGGWQAEENRKAEQARREAWEREEQIRQEAARVQREAEAKQAAIQAELERKASVARSAENAAKYEAEAARRKQQAEELERSRQEAAEKAIIETRVAASQVAAAKADGVSTRGKICFEVLDITALYEAAPYLVNLTVNTAAVNNALKNLGPGQSLPGIRHWKENVSVVR